MYPTPSFCSNRSNVNDSCDDNEIQTGGVGNNQGATRLVRILKISRTWCNMSQCVEGSVNLLQHLCAIKLLKHHFRTHILRRAAKLDWGFEMARNGVTNSSLNVDARDGNFMQVDW